MVVVVVVIGLIAGAVGMVAVAVDLSKEPMSRRRRWICRHRQQLWVWCSRADQCGEGDGGGSVDTGSVKVAVVDLSTQTATVGVVHSSWRVR